MEAVLESFLWALIIGGTVFWIFVGINAFAHHRSWVIVLWIATTVIILISVQVFGSTVHACFDADTTPAQCDARQNELPGWIAAHAIDSA